MEFVDVPQFEFLDKIVEVPVQKLVDELIQAREVQMTVAGPQLESVAVPRVEFVDIGVEVLVQMQVHAPMIQE